MQPVFHWAAREGFLPEPSLRTFILQNIIRPFFDQKELEGQRFSVTILFQNGKNSTKPLRWELKGKPSEAHVVVQCHHSAAAPRVASATIEITSPSSESPQGVPLNLIVKKIIRWDENGFYLTQN
ncbi:MAG: hypothetical protein EOP86_09115 [Verrucomicrobiaceae bacterium]|nr:MAG: hypothetical protein EOP86_09115 [Verrucomicrobiaceae bacterium]